jgi:hypothetical protein
MQIGGQKKFLLRGIKTGRREKQRFWTNLRPKGKSSLSDEASPDVRTMANERIPTTGNRNEALVCSCVYPRFLNQRMPEIRQSTSGSIPLGNRQNGGDAAVARTPAKSFGRTFLSACADRIRLLSHQ